MKRAFIMVLLAWYALNLQSNPSFTIGSNPYLTIFAFPGDLLLWPEKGVYFQYGSQKFPWQGDVMDIMNRPSESYTNSYQSIEFAPPSGYTGDPADVYSWMLTKGYAYKRMFSVGGIQTYNFGKFLGEIGLTSLRMDLEAEGVARADENAGYALVPFKGKTKGAEYSLQFKTIYAAKIKGNPFGAKVDFKYNRATEPEGMLEFTRDGVTYKNSHLTWGWANRSCNHIFGYAPINADAFYQNSYSIIRGYQLDLQSSYEVNGNKSGIRYRRIDEKGDNYRWIYDEGSDFYGHYEKDGDMITRNVMNLVRAYSKHIFWKVDNLDAGILFFLQHSRSSQYRVNRNSPDDPQSEDRQREFIIETNPFFNYKFSKGYIDFGLLIEGSYTRMKNMSPRWNEARGVEEKKVIRNSTPYAGWSTSWESFSQGYDVFFATGCETFTSINIYKRLSALGSITLLKKYSLQGKNYGNSAVPESGGEFEFNSTHKRKLTKNETWMTGSIGFSYGFGPVQTIGIFQLPLAYLNKRKTKLKEGTDVVFEHKKKNMWQVQEPAAFRILFVYSFGDGGHPGGRQ